jgi:23S rRNA (uracil1939-C5)-methyltransferase
VCDADVEAIAAGRRAAAGLAALRYVHADAQRFLLERTGDGVDLLVANPPRSGLGRGVARAILALAPVRLIVVSCDPPTLARDLGILAREGSYRIERLSPLDLFPQTAHLETVAVLTRESGLRPRRPGSSRPTAADSG